MERIVLYSAYTSKEKVKIGKHYGLNKNLPCYAMYIHVLKLKMANGKN